MGKYIYSVPLHVVITVESDSRTDAYKAAKDLAVENYADQADHLTFDTDDLKMSRPSLDCPGEYCDPELVD